MELCERTGSVTWVSLSVRNYRYFQVFDKNVRTKIKKLQVQNPSTHAQFQVTLI